MFSTAVPAPNCTQTPYRAEQATELIPSSQSCEHTKQQCDNKIHACGKHCCMYGHKYCTQMSCRNLEATGDAILTQLHRTAVLHQTNMYVDTTTVLTESCVPTSCWAVQAGTRNSRGNALQPQTKGGANAHKMERTKTPMIWHGIELAWRESSGHRPCRTRAARPLLLVWRCGRVDVVAFVPLFPAQLPPR